MVKISELIEDLMYIESQLGDIDVAIMDEDSPRSTKFFKLTVAEYKTNPYTSAPLPVEQYGGEVEGIALFLHNTFGMSKTHREDIKDFK